MVRLARYDSPDFSEQLPGVDYGRDTAQTAPGTPSPYPVPQIQGTTVSSALVIPFGSGFQNGDRVSVGPDDSQVPAQTDLYSGLDSNPLSGLAGDLVGTTGSGRGRAGGPGNPNAQVVASLAAQTAAAMRPR